jgi:hypothetical protein
VYSVRLGDYDSLVEQPVAAESSADFIFLTDDSTLSSQTWKLQLIEPLLPADIARSSRFPKICAHRFLPSYDVSIYIDARVQLKVTPERILQELFLEADCDMVCLQHSYRASLLDEFFAVVSAGRDDTLRCIEQINHYYLSPHYPLGPPIWGGFLIRRHNSEQVVGAMERWFQHVLRYSGRDQLSFNFVANSLGFAHRALPLDNFESEYHVWPLGTSRPRADLPVRPDYLPLGLVAPQAARAWTAPDVRIAALERAVGKLKQQTAKLARPKTTPWVALRRRVPVPERLRRLKRRIVGTPAGVETAVAVRKAQVRGAPRRRQVAFLVGGAEDASASTTVFSSQLREIADRRADALRIDTRIAHGLDHRDSILILSKSFLHSRRPEHLEELRSRGNVLIGCFVDHPMDPKKAKLLDSLIACSRQQHRFFLTALPEVPSFRVNHNLDSRIEYRPCQQERFSAAYFGEPANGLFLNVLSQLVTTHRTDTRSSQIAWARALCDYNCHYVLRPPLPEGVFKPFLKGYVAAACGAIVVADADDAEAFELLGPEYPFLVNARSVAEIRETLARAADAFAGPTWFLARGMVASLRREFEPDTIADQLATVLRPHL